MKRENRLDPEELSEAVEEAAERLFVGPAPGDRYRPPSEEDIAEASRRLFDGGGRSLHDVAGGGR